MPVDRVKAGSTGILVSREDELSRWGERETHVVRLYRVSAHAVKVCADFSKHKGKKKHGK